MKPKNVQTPQNRTFSHASQFYFSLQSTGKIFSAAVFGLILIACGRDPLIPESSKLAKISIEELALSDYDSYTFLMEALDPESVFIMEEKSFKKNSGHITTRVPPGGYLIHLNYFQGNDKIYSAAFCQEQYRNNIVILVPGSNEIRLNVCKPGENPINDSEVIITPALPDDPLKKNQASFYIKDGKLFDKGGFEFVMRGINNPHAYFLEKSYQALDQIKTLGFNTVRIVWCADNLIRENRCERKDFHDIAELRKILKRMRELNLVAVLNLQNATGSDDPKDLKAMVDWYLRPEVKRVLTDYQDMLIINIANEWFGGWVDPKQVYLNTYLQQIPRFRAAGLGHVLIVDARGWGQQFASIPENFSAIMGVDKNLMFSAHLYDVFDTRAAVEKVFETVRNRKIPFLVGEFGCVHYPGQPVDCGSIMREASRDGASYGYLAWSYSGNSSILEELDVTSRDDWKTLSSWGKILVDNKYGVKNTSRVACFFDVSACL